MLKVTVVADSSHKRRRADNSSSFTGWLPREYLILQLKQDVARLWQVAVADYVLCDGDGAVMPDDSCVETVLSDLHTTLVLKKISVLARAFDRDEDEEELVTTSVNTKDPFKVQEELYELFLTYALQTMNGKTPRITSYQFKTMLQKATAKSVFQGKRKVDFEARVLLSFKSCTPNATGVGATFDEFLDALLDVACYMFPKSSDKEAAFHRLLDDFILPLVARKNALAGAHGFSWTQMDALVARPKVEALLNRFTKPLSDLSACYSATIGGSRGYRGLQFHELVKMVHDMKPNSTPVTVQDLGHIFLRCCRSELRSTFSENATLASLHMRDSVHVTNAEAKKDAGGIWTTHGGNTNGITTTSAGALEISVLQIAKFLAYIALLTMPRLVRPKAVNKNPSRLRPSAKVAVQFIKAFLHHCAYHITSSCNKISKNATLAIAALSFLQEFRKLHREDGLEDYFSGCKTMIQENCAVENQAIASESSPIHVSESLPAPPAQLQEPKDTKADETNDGDDVNFEISWDDDEDKAKEDAPRSPEPAESQASDSSSDSEFEIDDEMLSKVLNEADEIYSFLASELQQLSGKRMNEPDTVSQLLDVWVAAGQKYSQAITVCEDPQLKASVTWRYGCSLYVFAMQVLRSCTTVYRYEDYFHVTNARVYSCKSELWDDTPGTFVIDLAKETLSLASGKLAAACSHYQELIEKQQGNEDSSAVPPDFSSLNLNGSSNPSWRYINCLLKRASCLAMYGDVMAHAKKCIVDYELGCTLEEEQDRNSNTSSPSIDSNIGATVGAVDAVKFFQGATLSKESTPAQFYREAKRIYRFALLNIQKEDAVALRTLQDLAIVQFKLSTHLPLGCVASKRLLDEASHTLQICAQRQVPTEGNLIAQKKDYIQAITILRQKFFLANSRPQEPDSPRRHRTGTDTIVPFYRFVLAAAFKDFDTENRSVLNQASMSRLNRACGRDDISNSEMTWLLENFDNQDGGLTEKGLIDYFCWAAEADPISFCDVLDTLTAISTDTHHASISSGEACVSIKETKATSQSATSWRPTATGMQVRKASDRPGIADCVVVLGGRVTDDNCTSLQTSTSLRDIQLDPEVIDFLPPSASIPDELSKFCFPDGIGFHTEPQPPKAFDIVLTDIKGSRLYASCLHFYEEKDPMDVLALISSVQKGKASLPSWISLREIQQGATRWKCFMPKCLCILSVNPLYQTFRSFLAQLYRLSISSSPIPIESYIFNFLEEVPLPPSSNTQSQFILADRAYLLVGHPTRLPVFYPTEVDFTLLFQYLSAENVIKAFGLILAEKKVVMCSNNYSILTPIAETLRALLYPFESQHVYIPILPKTLLDFMSAPVPFFMGVQSGSAIEGITNEGVVLINLDKDEVVIPTNEYMPNLPETKARKFLPTLRKACVWAASQKSRDHYGRFSPRELAEITSFEPGQPSDLELKQLARHNDELLEKWSELSGMFSTFTLRMLKDYRKFCQNTTASDGTERVTFDKKSFLAVHPSVREYCSHLFQTQLFERFIEHGATIHDSFAWAETESTYSWRAGKSRNATRRLELSEDGQAQQPRRTLAAPFPSKSYFNGAPSAPHHKPTGIFPVFNAEFYNELLIKSNKYSQVEPRPEDASALAKLRSPTLPFRTSNSFTSGDSTPLKLVSEARKKLEGPVVDDAAENR